MCAVRPRSHTRAACSGPGRELEHTSGRSFCGRLSTSTTGSITSSDPARTADRRKSAVRTGNCPFGARAYGPSRSGCPLRHPDARAAIVDQVGVAVDHEGPYWTAAVVPQPERSLRYGSTHGALVGRGDESWRGFDEIIVIYAEHRAGQRQLLRVRSGSCGGPPPKRPRNGRWRGSTGGCAAACPAPASTSKAVASTRPRRRDVAREGAELMGPPPCLPASAGCSAPDSCLAKRRCS